MSHGIRHGFASSQHTHLLDTHSKQATILCHCRHGVLYVLCGSSQVHADAQILFTVCLLQVPLLQHATACAQQGTFPGAVPRNLESYGQHLVFDSSMPEWQQHLMVDPQTSGGLLLAVAADQADKVLQQVKEAGCSKAAVIGQLKAGEPGVEFVV
jgi:selenophosphate synthase